MDRSARKAEFSGGTEAEPLILLKENRLAHTAVSRLVRATAKDPLWLAFLYGPAGVGKSHFVRHFLREARRQATGLRFRAEPTSAFVVEVNDARSRQQLAELQSDYAALDLMILEDLSAIDGRLAAQQLLVAILDEMKRSGGRAVITASSLPGEWKSVLPRLANRIRGGLCVPLELLDEQGRQSFATHLAARRQIPLSAAEGELLSRKGLATPREILAALVNLEMGTRRNRRDNDASFACAQLDSAKSATACSLLQIAKAVAEFYGVPSARLRSTDRHKRLDCPRQVAMVLARELTGRPVAEIARFFGRKNHATVVHACSRTRKLISSDPVLARDIDHLRRVLRRN